MIFELDDGNYFDPTHLLHEAMENGFPVEGADFDQVVEDTKAPTAEQARYSRGRLEWPGIGEGPPSEAETSSEGGGP